MIHDFKIGNRIKDQGGHIMQILRNYLFVTIIFLVFSAINADCAHRTVYVKTAPPAAKYEIKPAAPFHHAVWISGHWSWRNKKYVWIPGHWIKPRSDYVWIPGHWVKKRRGWVWVEGHWKKR